MKRRSYRDFQADNIIQLDRQRRSVTNRGTKAANWCAMAVPELVDDNGHPCSILVSCALRLRNRGQQVNRKTVIAEWKQEIIRYPSLHDYWKERLETRETS